jgi:hypothetical protein
MTTIPYLGAWLAEQTGSTLDTIVAALRIVLALDYQDVSIRYGDDLAVRVNDRITTINLLSEGYRSVCVIGSTAFRLAISINDLAGRSVQAQNKP